MDCRTARLLLDFARPPGAELEGGDAEALDSHLADCPECGPLARQERRLDDHLGQAVRAVPVPGDLRDRLLNRLAVARDAWYRKWLVRAAGMVAAAALLVAVVWVVKGGLRPGVDLDEVAAANSRLGATPEEVEAFFRDRYGIHTFAPSDKELYYSRLIDYDLVEFGDTGKRVPQLLFAATANDPNAPLVPAGRPILAKVFILTDTEFKGLAEQLDQPPKGSKGFAVKVLRNPDHPHFYYVVMYTEGAAAYFFVARTPPAA
jgi:hypothetical protein